MVVESGNFLIRKVKLPYCLTVRKRSFGPHPRKGTPFCQYQNTGNAFEPRQNIMSISVTLQDVYTHGTLITQTTRELQQLRCISFSHESWARENYSLCMVYMHANVLCACNVHASTTIYTGPTTGIEPEHSI